MTAISKTAPALMDYAPLTGRMAKKTVLRKRARTTGRGVK